MDGIRNELVFKFHSDMKKLHVSLIFLDHIRLDVWLASAVWRKVQEIDLSLLVGERVTLPDMIFISQSLKVLKIEMDSVLELPANISLPCLKTLRLSLVSLPSTELIQNLFSSCPVLEGLALLDCVWPPIRTITISIPTLKTLEIDDELPSFGSMTVPNGFQIKIYGRNLVSLKYKGALSYEIFLYDISSLVVAEIEIPNLYLTQEETARRGARLLRAMGNARSVTLSNGAIQVQYFICFSIITS